jgi:succinyl-diaminopimelate desuccinylase
MIPKVTEAVFEVMGIKPDVNTFGGTSDARFLTTYCPVVELGLLNDTAHKIDEMVTIEDLENLTQVYLRVLKKFQICD